MIGKPEWFARRKYTGWGLTPVTWQGWAYTAATIAPIIVLFSVSPRVGQTQLAFVIVWCVLVGIDFIDIMLHLPKDERDYLHEAIAERNALWVIIFVLVVDIAYEAASSTALGMTKVDPVILVALVAGTLAKMVSNIYLDRKD